MLKEVILYSSSIQFLTITEKYLKTHEINVLNTFKELTELKNVSDAQKNKLFIIKLKKDDIKTSKEIIEFLNKNNIKWICVSCDKNFNLTKKNTLEYLYVSETPTSTEFKIFLKCLHNKINNYFQNFTNTNYKTVITIGGSTGGTDAVEYILKNLPKNIPPILIALHMPPVFTDLYAKRLNEFCQMEVKEAKDGDSLKPGVALIAPGGFQMRVENNNNNFFVSCSEEGKINGHQPSINVLFSSVADVLTPNVISILLTGMGDDGAKGLLKIKQNGGYTVGQDEASSIVYGMPKVAYDIGATLIQANLEDIPKIIENHIIN